ncbi:MAG: hypothetical protein QY327_06380 [Fimbriimonadaceae bacterium]|nr:MAG: hypothetical protein QY327_06380 [Fimbriimonadaceae bacterium]
MAVIAGITLKTLMIHLEELRPSGECYQNRNDLAGMLSACHVHSGHQNMTCFAHSCGKHANGQVWISVH